MKQSIILNCLLAVVFLMKLNSADESSEQPTFDGNLKYKKQHPHPKYFQISILFLLDTWEQFKVNNNKTYDSESEVT